VIEVRRARGSDATALRALRLRALADAPAAFASSLSDEAARPDSYWSELTQDAVVFVAVEGQAWVGMAATRWFDREQGVVQLWGMWVDPAVRRCGLGERLVSEVDRWAGENGARALRLGVIEGVADAEAFYRRLGFARTGETKRLSRDEAMTAFFLARPVASA
jgi:GNAT superfamily N-acetyltransferase